MAVYVWLRFFVSFYCVSFFKHLILPSSLLFIFNDVYIFFVLLYFLYNCTHNYNLLFLVDTVECLLLHCNYQYNYKFYWFVVLFVVTKHAVYNFCHIFDYEWSLYKKVLYLAQIILIDGLLDEKIYSWNKIVGNF